MKQKAKIISQKEEKENFLNILFLKKKNGLEEKKN